MKNWTSKFEPTWLSCDPINNAIAIATACGIVRDADSILLSENGGHINLIKDWAKYLNELCKEAW